MPRSVHQKGEPVTSNAESAIEQCQQLNRDKVCHLVCLPDFLVRQKLQCTSEARFGENLSQGVWTQQSMSCTVASWWLWMVRGLLLIVYMYTALSLKQEVIFGKNLS